jgi:hypothetical protein
LPIAVGASLILLTGVADATSTTCTTSAVCAEYINTSSGVAIHGEANTGIGIRGTSNSSTGFYGATRSGSMLFPGVEGESLDQTGDDAAGAFGLNAVNGGSAPAYGVLAYGSVYGAFGVAAGPGNGASGLPTSVGLLGNDTGGDALSGGNVAILGQSTHGNALLALANVTPASAANYRAFGEGVYAEAEPDQSGTIAVGLRALSRSIALAAVNSDSGDEVDVATSHFAMTTASSYAYNFTVDYYGNVSAQALSTHHGSYVRTTDSAGMARIEYSARAASPVMEDSGEGHVVNGRGYVKLDPALADVIDTRDAFRVILTPEGESDGLYVAQKSPSGFLVREARGGRSTLAFDYRIIAKPFNDNEARLAPAPPLRRPDLKLWDHHSAQPISPQPLDPLARLRLHIGSAAFARERQAAKKIEAGP